MQLVSTLMASAALISGAMAHYNFEALIVNGNVTEPYEYVRKVTNSNSPITSVTDTNLRCNVGGSNGTWSGTKTYTVSAGSEVGFTVNDKIGHPGPLSIYMSKSTTDDVSAYDGSGDWFKIYESPPNITSEGLQWATSDATSWNFTLPSEVPAGQYLLRAEHIALHGASTVGGAQVYVGCSQLDVTSSSTATPENTVSIPGAYTATDPGLLLNIYYPVPTNYTMPGPAVWPSSSDSSSSGSVSGSNSTTSKCKRSHGRRSFRFHSDY